MTAANQYLALGMLAYIFAEHVGDRWVRLIARIAAAFYFFLSAFVVLEGQFS